MNTVPYLPDSAPFTPEQRAYLNGFLAGLFSRTSQPSQPADRDNAPSGKSVRPLTILFGSQTGNAEGLAKRVSKEAGKNGFAAKAMDMAEYSPANLEREQNLLIITSTYGDGDPPDNAKAFWEFLQSDRVPSLSRLSFAVLALGDSNYAKFCECGKQFDSRLHELGGRRICPRVDCDVDFDAPFQEWLGTVLARFDSPADENAHLSSPEAGSVAPGQAMTDPEESLRGSSVQTEKGFEIATPRYSRTNPFPAPLLVSQVLNGAGSSKETRHFEFSLQGSELKYEAGDALGVIPSNCPELVEEILARLGASGDEPVPGESGEIISFHQILLQRVEITRISQPFLQAMAQLTGDETLTKLASPQANGELAKFLWGREVIDLLTAFPRVKFEPAEFVRLLKKLQPRLYSISSSPTAHKGQVHLTVGIVRYESLDRKRKGICSCFLADRTPTGTRVPVFVHSNKNFRLPADPNTPVIMVGPGTGIAPFRGFLHERQSAGAPGKSWLFFGEQHRATDFLYRDELETMLRHGSLTRLDTAFSRDQEQKIYVQHRMLDRAKELFDWLEQGAHFYVCGDAKRMAKDVDEALHRVIESAGDRTPEQAAEYVAALKKSKRYQRDVY